MQSGVSFVVVSFFRYIGYSCIQMKCIFSQDIKHIHKVAHQAPLFTGFSRQEYWSGLLFPSLGDLPNPGIKPRSSVLQTDPLPTEPPGKPLTPVRYLNSTKWLSGLLTSPITRDSSVPSARCGWLCKTVFLYIENLPNWKYHLNP